MIRIPLNKIVLQENMRKHITKETPNMYEKGTIGQLQQYKFDKLNEKTENIIPPISVHKFFGFYYIINGRHRVVHAINNNESYINAKLYN